jgi:hypothetical protein
MVGAGFYRFDKRVLAGYRSYIKEDIHAKSLDEILKSLVKIGFEVGNVGYKRTPKGLDKNSPYAHLYLFYGLRAGVQMPHPTWLFEECRYAYHLATPRIITWPPCVSTSGHFTHHLFGQRSSNDAHIRFS